MCLNPGSEGKRGSDCGPTQTLPCVLTTQRWQAGSGPLSPRTSSLSLHLSIAYILYSSCRTKDERIDFVLMPEYVCNMYFIQSRQTHRPIRLFHYSSGLYLLSDKNILFYFILFSQDIFNIFDNTLVYNLNTIYYIKFNNYYIH